MDSPPLARQKLAHIRVWDARMARLSAAPPAPESVLVPAAWLAKGGAMTQMVTRDDERGFDVLLLLLRQAAVEGTPVFLVDLTRLGLESGVSPARRSDRVRLEMIRVIRRLQSRYAAAAIEVIPWSEARVTLTLPAGPAVAVPGRWTNPETVTRLSSEAGYLLLLGEALRQNEHVEADALTLVELSARTGLSRELLGHARRELKS
jgi:hypothetical protein